MHETKEKSRQRNMLLKLHKEQRVVRQVTDTTSSESVMAIEINKNDQLVLPVAATVKWRRLGRHFVTLKLDSSRDGDGKRQVQLDDPIDEIIRNTSNTNRLKTYFA